MSYYETGYKVIEWIQQFQNPALDAFFVGISALGVKEFYLIALPLAYWCVNKRFGARLAFLFFGGILLNTWTKFFVHTTRPDPERVRVLFAKSGGGFSFPSGHAQGSTAFWGFTMLFFKKPWLSVLSVGLILSMCYSRMYLGVHYIWDVLGGIGLGVLSLIFLFWLIKLYEKMKPKLPWGAWIAIAAVTAFALAWLFPEPRYGFILGGFLGFCAGTVVEERFIGFTVQRDIGKQIGKALLGLGVALGLLSGGEMLLADLPRGHFLHYTILGAWVSVGAPWVFKKLKWA